jgi:hypothetical protein
MSSIFAGRKFFLSKNLPVYELDRVSQILIKEGATISYKYELDNIYVIHDFEQEEFQELWRQLRQQGVTHPPIVGVPCIEQSVELKKPLPPPEKFPLFMRIFEGIVICFSGFLKEEQVGRSLFLILLAFRHTFSHKADEFEFNPWNIHMVLSGSVSALLFVRIDGCEDEQTPLQ